MKTPKFSFIVPTYNRGELLIKTIESLKAQTINDFEILIIDDGSTDNTVEIINRLKCDNLHYFKISNRERGAARNFGVKHAKGEYVNFFDSDDIAYPNHLEIANSILDSHKKIDVFATSYEIKKPEGTLIKSVVLDLPVKTFICEGNHLSCNGVFIRREIALKNPFSEIRELSGSEDYELWLRLSARYQFPCFPIISHAVIHHDERSTSNFNPEPLILRKEIMLREAFANEYVFNTYQSKVKLLTGTTFAYIALHIALMPNKKRLAFKWWVKSLNTLPSIVFTKRNLAIIKHLLFTNK